MTRARTAQSLAALAAMTWMLHGPGNAAAYDQVALGPRAVGMGGAFTGVADDVSAMYWNPAGLSLIGHQEIAVYTTNLYGSDIRDNYLAFLLPLTPRLAVGVDWYHSGFTDPELDYGENRFDLAASTRLGSRISVALTGKLLTRSVGLDGSSIRDGNGVGLDLGVLATPMPRLTVGLLAQDLFDTEINNSETNTATVAYHQALRVGASYSVIPGARVAFDVDDRVHLGGEFQPISEITLRAGLQKSRETDEGVIVDLGGSVEYSILRFDYAFESHPDLGSTNYLGFTSAFNFNPSQIRIEEVQPKPLYASLFKSYATHPFASVTVRNLKDEPLDTRFSVFVPGYMDEPSQQEISLRPRASQEVDLTAVFTDKALARAGDHPLEIQLAATYQSARLPRTEKKTIRTHSYGPGAISWALGVDQAAAFVTTHDPVISAFAREASRTAALGDGSAFGQRNIAFAAAIFSGLEELGVAYVPDPNDPYSTISETEHAVDTIHYPRQSLRERTGDCDDTTVLLASLLGNVGINTRFVDAPGHLFLLFDSGVGERNRMSLALDEALAPVIDGVVWIPMETTALGRGFAEAWRTGAEEYASWTARGRLATVDVAKAQLKYEPAIPPGDAGAQDWDLPGLEKRLLAAKDAIGAWQDQYLASRYGEAPKESVSTAALGELARVYYDAGDLAKAGEKLEQVLQVDPASAFAHNNLALVRAREGNWVEAKAELQAALAAQPKNPRIWLNLALVQSAAGDAEDARQALKRGLELPGGVATARELLGLSAEQEQALQGGDGGIKADQVLGPATADLERLAGRLSWSSP